MFSFPDSENDSSYFKFDYTYNGLIIDEINEVLFNHFLNNGYKPLSSFYANSFDLFKGKININGDTIRYKGEYFTSSSIFKPESGLSLEYKNYRIKPNDPTLINFRIPKENLLTELDDYSFLYKMLFLKPKEISTVKAAFYFPVNPLIIDKITNKEFTLKLLTK